MKNLLRVEDAVVFLDGWGGEPLRQGRAQPRGGEERRHRSLGGRRWNSRRRNRRRRRFGGWHGDQLDRVTIIRLRDRDVGDRDLAVAVEVGSRGDAGGLAVERAHEADVSDGDGGGGGVVASLADEVAEVEHV